MATLPKQGSFGMDGTNFATTPEHAARHSRTHPYPRLQFPLDPPELMPATAPYRPDGHRLHPPALPRLYRPKGHTPAVELVDPATQKYPAAHGPLHDADVSPLVAP